MLEDRDVVAVSPGRLSWGAIFGGAFAAMGIWVLLALFGLAIGFSSVNPEEPNVRGVGIWLGVWILVVPILAMFVGGAIATRAATVARRATGALYGTVVWSISTVLGTILTFFTLSAVIGGTLSTTGQVVSAAGSAVGTAGSAMGSVAQAGAQNGQAVQAVGNFLNIDRTQIVTAVNQRLQQRGLPPVQPEQMQAALQDAANTALQRGELNQEILVGALTRNTQLDRQEIQQVAQQLEQEWNQATAQLSQRAQQVGGTIVTGVLRGVEVVGNGIWFIFGSTLLGLLAAIGGGMFVAARYFERAGAVEEPVGAPTRPRFDPAPART